MPTEKPRVTFAVSEETLSKIDDYRFSSKAKNQSQAIISLLEKALNDFSPESKNAPSVSDEAMKVARDYENLDSHGKSMVRVIISEEKKRIREFGHLEHRPMIQAAAYGGGVKQIQEIHPDELPTDEEPLP